MTREEAIQIIRGTYHTDEEMNALGILIPELRESEDERIRKEIIEHIEDQIHSFISAPDCRDKYEEEELARYKSWIAYLEKQKEQKPAWSEDDEKMLNDCIMALSNWRDAVANYGHKVAPCQKLIDWLKSLRPSWKPSKEQMKALNTTISLSNYGIDIERKNMLLSLYEQLKKL